MSESVLYSESVSGSVPIGNLGYFGPQPQLRIVAPPLLQGHHHQHLYHPHDLIQFHFSLTHGGWVR